MYPAMKPGSTMARYYESTMAVFQLSIVFDHPGSFCFRFPTHFGRGWQGCTPTRSDSCVEEGAQEDHTCANAELGVPPVPEPPHAETKADGLAGREHQVC